MVNFVVRIIEFKKQLQFDSLMVAYSAFYTQENIQIVVNRSDRAQKLYCFLRNREKGTESREEF